jgi:hypothetical protein
MAVYQLILVAHHFPMRASHLIVFVCMEVSIAVSGEILLVQLSLSTVCAT